MKNISIVTIPGFGTQVTCETRCISTIPVSSKIISGDKDWRRLYNRAKILKKDLEITGELLSVYQQIFLGGLLEAQFTFKTDDTSN